MMRLRLGKFWELGRTPRGCSDTNAPLPAMSSARLACSLGYITSSPLPITAMVLCPASRAARCATASTPRASPLTITMPARARSDVIR
jgi:hypothetical protein